MTDLDDLLFADDEESRSTTAGSETGDAHGTWKLLLVDDEPDVHAVTRMALSGIVVDNKPVDILSAHSRLEAEGVLATHDDIALAVLDVVMETEDTGLVLAEHIRQTYPDKSIRLVLRTGQPGSAPEERILRDYDINDYWSKTELTSKRMRTLVTGNIRSYRDLRLVETYSRQLEQRNLELERLKDDLERIVEERTVELIRAKAQLEIVNRQLAERNTVLTEAVARDSLTGLINHGTFLTRLDSVLSLPGRGPLALILVDIDHFKRFNDAYGHVAGDAALCAVARLLEGGVRGRDFAARVGGEEFALLLQDCDLEMAIGVAERLRSEIALIEFDDRSIAAITASFGVAVAAPGDQRASLLGRADSALYASKNAGRNRVTSHEDSATDQSKA